VPHWLQLMIDSLPTLLWAGVKFTIPLTLLSFTLGLTLGLATAVARLFGPWPVSAIARFYVWIIRGTPLLVQLFVIFYGLPSVGILHILGTEGSVGSRLFHRHELASGDAAHDPAAGKPGFRTAFGKHLHITGQGYLACSGNHRAGTVPVCAAHRRHDL
jgi:His/Glu/Gln/Arg/opine family amino acid ABC transporter permease subunit